MDAITFLAAVAKVTTLADGAIRVHLDLPEDTAFEAAQLMECKRLEVYGKVTFEPTNLTELNDETEKSATGATAGLDSRRIDLRRNK